MTTVSQGDRIADRSRAHARNRGLNVAHFQSRVAREQLLTALHAVDEDEVLVLRGSTLTELLGKSDRATHDLDVHAGSLAVDELCSLLRHAAVVARDTGLEFQFGEPRELAHHGERRGARVRVDCFLGKTSASFDLDVAFGTDRVPGIERKTAPASIPGLPDVTYLAAPLESVVADKLHAVSQFGENNTRLKDYFDLWHLASAPLDERLLATRTEHVYDRCGTRIPATAAIEPGFSVAFAAANQQAWTRWVAKQGLEGIAPASFADVVQVAGELANVAYYRVAAREFAEAYAPAYA